MCSNHMIILWSKKWTLETCVSDALNYSTLKEWRINSGSAYTTACAKNWLNQCIKHMIPLGSRFKRMIYAFEFSDMSVYVGLTFNIKNRVTEHLNPKRIKKSTVYKHIEKTGITPVVKHLTKYINSNIAILKENEFLEKYKNKGWNILNRVRTGALGGNVVFWNKERCIADALRFKTRNDWRKNSATAYNVARKNKWSKECYKHMLTLIKPHGYWTLNKCIIDALQYKTKTEWRNNSSSAYSISLKKGWFNECTQHM